jgi:hypothetical protein
MRLVAGCDLKKKEFECKKNSSVKINGVLVRIFEYWNTLQLFRVRSRVVTFDLKLNLSILPTRCILVLHVTVAIITDYLPKQNHTVWSLQHKHNVSIMR